MKKVALLGSIFIFIILGVIIYMVSRHTDQRQATHPSIISDTTLGSLPHKDASGIDLSHIGRGLTPPTNKWFSGLALQKEPKAVFPSPLSFLAKETSFEIGLPSVTATSKTIYGAHTADLSVAIKDATSYTVTRYDELTVDLTYSAGTTPIGTLTLTAGSPLIFFVAARDTTLTLATTSPAHISNNRASLSTDKTTSVIAGFNKASITKSSSQVSAKLSSGSFVSFYELPKDGPDVLSELAAHRITSSQVHYTKNDNSYTTTISVETADQHPTALSFMPHQSTQHKLTDLQYDTIYGSTPIATGKSFKFTTPSVPTSESLDVNKISAADRALLTTTLRQDINATIFTAEDSYFGGKSLYRAAQLLELAHQLGENQIAASIQQKLRRELITWLSVSPRSIKSFYYDTAIRGVVGQTIAFGSEEFNDHHFHYGYFIYAASILAKYDAEFLDQNKDVVNLIVADIANYNNKENLPLRRVFDPYFGHSWASGSSPFADGNNQESSSEAINAWIAVELWATRTNNDDLRTEAAWMISNEVASTSSYWMNFNKDTKLYTGYDHTLVSLNWGGKRDYGTFFSAEPNAMLGIQLLPMSPTTALYQSRYDARITQHVNEALPGMDINAQFADYILMYSVLAKKSNQLDTAKTIPDEKIDSANSRSYIYAWIMSRK